MFLCPPATISTSWTSNYSSSRHKPAKTLSTPRQPKSSVSQAATRARCLSDAIQYGYSLSSQCLIKVVSRWGGRFVTCSGNTVYILSACKKGTGHAYATLGDIFFRSLCVRDRMIPAPILVFQQMHPRGLTFPEDWSPNPQCMRPVFSGAPR